MKPEARRTPEFVMTPESAVWLLYAGLVQGMRWRRHLAASPGPSPTPVSRRGRGLARR